MSSTITTHRLAPGPRGLPLVGSLPAYRKDPVQFMLELHRDYGGVVRMRLGPYLAHLVTDPGGVGHVLQENDANYWRGQFYQKFKIFFGDGLLTSDGDFWRSHRRITQPAFLKKVVERSTTSVVEATNEILDEWGEAAAAGRSIDVVPEMLRLTLAALSRSLFGIDVSDAREQIGRAVDCGVSAMFNHGNLSEMLPLWIPTRRNRTIASSRETLNGMIDRIQAEHRPDQAAVDLVDLVQEARDPGTGAPWTHQEIHDELMTIFMAGHETTALAMCWALYAVAQHKNVREELEAEVDTVLGDGLPTLEQLNRLPYTYMVVQEALRVYPPIWLYTRDATEDDVIAGYHVPAGSSVLLSPIVTHRHPEHWTDPEMFDPYRFAPGQAKQRPRFAYFPFGGGARQCIGMHMALQELRIVVAMVTHRFRMEVVPGCPVRYGGRVLSLRPTKGLVIRLRSREGRLASMSGAG